MTDLSRFTKDNLADFFYECKTTTRVLVPQNITDALTEYNRAVKIELRSTKNIHNNATVKALAVCEAYDNLSLVQRLFFPSTFGESRLMKAYYFLKKNNLLTDAEKNANFALISQMDLDPYKTALLLSLLRNAFPTAQGAREFLLTYPQPKELFKRVGIMSKVGFSEEEFSQSIPAYSDHSISITNRALEYALKMHLLEGPLRTERFKQIINHSDVVSLSALLIKIYQCHPAISRTQTFEKILTKKDIDTLDWALRIFHKQNLLIPHAKIIFDLLLDHSEILIGNKKIFGHLTALEHAPYLLLKLIEQAGDIKKICQKSHLSVAARQTEFSHFVNRILERNPVHTNLLTPIKTGVPERMAARVPQMRGEL